MEAAKPHGPLCEIQWYGLPESSVLRTWEADGVGVAWEPGACGQDGVYVPEQAVRQRTVANSSAFLFDAGL